MHVLHGWQAGKRRVLNRSVTIAAVDAEMANMVLVAEGNALHVHDTDPGAVCGASVDETGPRTERPERGSCRRASP